MIFEYDLTISAATTRRSPVTQDLQLARGIIHKVEVIFPPGCHHQVFVVIRRGLNQVFPTNPDNQFKGDFFPVSYPVWYPMEAGPFRLKAYGWAPDTTYDHAVIIRLGLLPREVLEPGREAVGILSKLRDLIFGRA